MELGLAVNNTRYFENNYLMSNKFSGAETSAFKHLIFFRNDDRRDKDISSCTTGREMSKQELFEKLKASSAGVQSRIQKKSAIEAIAIEEEVSDSELKNIGLTSFELSDTASQLVVASLVKNSEPDNPIIQVSYGRGDARKVYHVHVNDIDTTNASDLEMFALLSYEGYKGRTAPDAINNYAAYKTMKFGAGLGMSSSSENSFVNEKINVDELLQQVYELLKDGKSAEEKKSAENCDYLIQLLKKHSDHD